MSTHIKLDVNLTNSANLTNLSAIYTTSHCAKDLLILKKIQPNLIPSKTTPIRCVDLNSKVKFAICHWTWEGDRLYLAFTKKIRLLCEH